MITPEQIQSALTRTSAILTQGWCQHDHAQTADGAWTWSGSPTAARWSLAGALNESLRELHLSMHYPRVMQTLREQLPPPHRDPEDWQDLPTTTLADVLALVERVKTEVAL